MSPTNEEIPSIPAFPTSAGPAGTPGGFASRRVIPTIPATGSMLPTVLQLPPKRTMTPWLIGLGVFGGFAATVYLFRAALLIAFAAFAIAYVCAPAVARLRSFRVPRSLSILSVLLGGTTMIVGSFALVIPEILRQLQIVIQSLPHYAQVVQRVWLPWLRGSLHLRIPARTDDAMAQLGLRASSIGASLPNVATSSFSAGVFVLEALFTTLIVITLAYYFSADYDRIHERTIDLIPHRVRPQVNALLREMNETLRHFISGQLLVMAVLGGLYSVGLGALGVPAGWAIGLFSGVISFVPYLGFFMALGLALFMTAVSGQGSAHLLGVAGVMVAVHILDLSLITPRIVGNRTRLSPASVIISMLAGGAVFGLAGVFFAIPAASIIAVLVRHFVSLYKESNYFLTDSDVSIASVPITGVPYEMLAELAGELDPSPLAYRPRGSRPPPEPRTPSASREAVPEPVAPSDAHTP
ncbi:MAG: AI-2E family transporter [Deltaproteobacteria bacterium]|nr:AI-2E family transporter [Deltaproteobacteria bacterium]